MISDTCISIKTKKFPILEGEDEELVNEGMYGKALCEYLQNKLPSVGLEVLFYCCEDWGWWIEVKDEDFLLGLCVYSNPNIEPGQNPERYVILSSNTKETQWSWKKLRKINISTKITKVMDKVESVFINDNEIFNVTKHDDYPF